jgi:ribosomal protein S13
MPEMMTMESPKKAGFVDRSFNNQQRKKRMEEEEKEIAKLEAEARGEEYIEESEPSSESTEDTQVQTSSDTQQEEQAPQEGETQEDDATEGLSAEEKSFKKRYGDLRRHMQEKEKEWNEKIEALEKRKSKESIIPPKSDEDIEAWAKEYPDVAGIVERIASEKAKEMFSKAESRLQELDDAHNEALRMKAENVIRKSHEDFDELRSSDEFHDWAEAQPKWVKDALYENMDDPASVIRVIDLYKVDNNMTPTAKKNTKKAAASSVVKGTRTSIDTKGVSGQIKESDVAKMSAKEFEKRQDDISEAMRTGKFIYDISGAAR